MDNRVDFSESFLEGNFFFFFLEQNKEKRANRHTE